MSTETQNNAPVSAELGAKVDAIVRTVREMAQEKPTSVNAYGLSTWTKAEKLMKYSQQNTFVEQIFREDRESSSSESLNNHQRLISTLNAKLIHQINMEYSLREANTKLKTRVQYYQDEYLSVSRQLGHLETNERNLHSKIVHLTQSLLTLEKEKSKTHPLFVRCTELP